MQTTDDGRTLALLNKKCLKFSKFVCKSYVETMEVTGKKLITNVFKRAN